MREARRRFAVVLGLAAAVVPMCGCAIDVGSTSASGRGERLDRLESRIAAAERRLGIDGAADPKGGMR